jgi:hypothetical protein
MQLELIERVTGVTGHSDRMSVADQRTNPLRRSALRAEPVAALE